MRLDIDNLKFSYDGGGRSVIDGLSLTYESPEALCILGSNGTGKSTLLQCVIGAFKPTGGEVRIDGRPVGSYAMRDLARLVAYIPQTHVPAFEYPVIDVVTMGRTSIIGRFSTPGAADEACALEKLDFLGIAHLRDKPYTQISGGERQLVMIASALAQEPDVLVLDEPTAHLDFGNQYRFVKLVEQLCAQGMGVIMTTHFPDHALELGGTTAVMGEGRITCAGPAREVITPDSMGALYGIEVNVERIGGRSICIPGPLEG
ncbi:ABC transporter ATP-binding protein [Eggerthella guodeyinii]|uniref:ABC transporter ATP-binding protein n=1 Tax=Eggerthella guodeyinii TaxID=2690837 RepID=A0A6L7IX87_9ACTN|nr:ABC transporter ATP-binding protein [Eggerthella guodeyinii]QOS67447.1 ABC transporter ATP-binding protein [Eggerthella guodeyinii]